MRWWRAWFVDVEKAALRMLVRLQRRELSVVRKQQAYRRHAFAAVRAGDKLTALLHSVTELLARIDAKLDSDSAPAAAETLVVILIGVAGMSTRLKFALNFPAVSDDRIANRDVSVTVAGQPQIDLPGIGLAAVTLDSATVNGAAQPFEGDLGQGVAVSVTTVGTGGKLTVRRFEFTLDDPFAPPASADITLTVTAEVPPPAPAPEPSPSLPSGTGPEPAPSPSPPAGTGPEPTPAPPAPPAA